MASRKRDEPGIEVILILVVLVACAVCVLLLPIAWLYYEFRNLSAEKPVDGFGLQPDEYAHAKKGVEGIMLAETLLDEVERQAVEAGCKLRSDGFWDERKPIAKELNAERAGLESDLESAEWALRLAARGPESRFEEWHYYNSMAWAARAVMLSLVILFAIYPNLLTEYLLGPFLGPEDMLDAVVGMGMASIPALAAGGVGGFIGWVVGSSFGEDLHPGDISTLMRDYEAMNVVSSSSTSSSQASGIDNSAEISDQDARVIGARAIALVVAHLFWADGEISIVERAASEMLEADLFSDILGQADTPDIRAELRQLITGERPSREVVQQACSLLSAVEMLDWLPGFLVGVQSTIQSGMSQLDREALVEVLSWMDVDQSKIEKLLTEATADEGV